MKYFLQTKTGKIVYCLPTNTLKVIPIEQYFTSYYTRYVLKLNCKNFQGFMNKLKRTF